jgi:UDP-N-acetylglucosamine 2-epimerase (non-hydrolysing)
MPIKVLVIIGTRPEVIKMAPVLYELKQHPKVFDVKLCVINQQFGILELSLREWELRPDYRIELKISQFDFTTMLASMLAPLRERLLDLKPNLVLVHGDTTTALAGALTAFGAGVTVGHVEAGLRSHDLQKPFPEEFNRVTIDRLASVLYAPTEIARLNLLREGYKEDNIVVVGNTVVDALLLTSETSIAKLPQAVWHNGHRMLLVTSHRRENFGDGVRSICEALRTLLFMYSGINVVYVMHPNPNAHEPIMETLKETPRLRLTGPCSYQEFIKLMCESFLIITDSGGVQEEAPYFGKPVLVLREETERPESIERGIAQIVSTDPKVIVEAVIELLDDETKYNLMARQVQLYGDGHAAGRIRTDLSRRFVLSS